MSKKDNMTKLVCDMLTELDTIEKTPMKPSKKRRAVVMLVAKSQARYSKLLQASN